SFVNFDFHRLFCISVFQNPLEHEFTERHELFNKVAHVRICHIVAENWQEPRSTGLTRLWSRQIKWKNPENNLWAEGTDSVSEYFVGFLFPLEPFVPSQVAYYLDSIKH